ncbi:MAG TPA: baseplate J/gp47 family protein [Thermoanaerobaculia bacterium]|nr:baseplate J/gp47 family protein [Thermoanaerobaculia bacterium]
MSDLTRWNRAGLPRFRYVDGNAASYLEELRLALLSRFLDPAPDPDAPDLGASLDWWKALWKNPPQDPAEKAAVEALLTEVQSRLRWKGPAGTGPLWVHPPDRRELETEESQRLADQYEAGRGDLAWELVRSFARGVHVLTEHLDAYANEGYLGTATQWESVRRLVSMLDVRPAPPASASTLLALDAKAGRQGTVVRGFQVKHSPPEGGAPVFFESLEDLEVDASLNELRPRDHDRNPAPALGSRIDLEGRVKGLKAGEPLVLEDERNGSLHGYVIQSVSEGEAVTSVEVAPAVASQIPKGYAIVHAGPKERVAPLAPASKGVQLGKALQLTEEPVGLLPGDVVWISDGKQPRYRQVQNVRGRQVLFDDDLGELRVDQTVVGRPFVLPVNQVVSREITRDNSGTLQATILVVKVAGDWTRLAGVWLADKRLKDGKKLLPPYQAIGADFRPAGSVIDGVPDSNAGYTLLRLEWKHDVDLFNPQSLLAPPPGGGIWRADRFLEKTSGKLPPAITTVLPKKAAAGDLAVVSSGKTLAWTRLDSIEADADAGEAVLRASAASGWQDRGGGPFFLAETRVFTKFERSARILGWDANPTPLAGASFPAPAVIPAPLRPGRTVLVELDDVPAGAVGARIVAVTDKEITLDRPLPAGARQDNLLLRANAVLAGHGESKPERALGSGDASRSDQTFRFDEAGVSFVADPGQPSGVRAAIEVRVGDRVWQQVPTLADSGPADPHYTVRMTEDGGVELAFGDGRNGRRLPTGVNNVRLSYRSGTGLSGNLPAGRLVKPARPHPLIEAVRQPLPATGGNDMEGVESMRATAPASVSTLGRAVSLEDYGRLAASQSSVWQARAFALPTGLARQDSVRVVVVPAGGGEIGTLGTAVRAFLTAHALPGVSVQVDPYQPVPVDLRVTLQIVTAEYDPERVVEAVRARLLAIFGLRGRKLGQALRLSEIYRVVEAVSGVANSLCILNNDPKLARVEAPADGVASLDAAGSFLTVTYKEFEL